MKIRRDQDASFIEFLLDQLDGRPSLETRRMFGGHGVYHDDRIVGIIYQSALYLKTDAQTQPLYIKAGMQPFKPNAKQTLRRYYQVPVAVLENAEQLQTWVQAAINASESDSG